MRLCEWEASAALISAKQRAPWHRASFSGILIRQCLKLRRTENEGAQRGILQAQEKACAVLLEGLCQAEGRG